DVLLSLMPPRRGWGSASRLPLPPEGGTPTPRPRCHRPLVSAGGAAFASSCILTYTYTGPTVDRPRGTWASATTGAAPSRPGDPHRAQHTPDPPTAPSPAGAGPLGTSPYTHSPYSDTPGG